MLQKVAARGRPAQAQAQAAQAQSQAIQREAAAAAHAQQVMWQQAQAQQQAAAAAAEAAIAMDLGMHVSQVSQDGSAASTQSYGSQQLLMEPAMGLQQAQNVNRTLLGVAGDVGMTVVSTPTGAHR